MIMTNVKFPCVCDIHQSNGQKIPNCCVLQTCFVTNMVIYNLYHSNVLIAVYNPYSKCVEFHSTDWNKGSGIRDIVRNFINQFTPKELHVKSIGDIKRNIRRGKFKVVE